LGQQPRGARSAGMKVIKRGGNCRFVRRRLARSGPCSCSGRV